jgi:hypothetical protein
MKLSDDEVAKATDALRRGDARAAAHICLSASNVFFNSLVADVEYVLTRTPQALSDCPNEILQPLRIAAGLMILGGYAHPIRRFIAADAEYNYRYTPETVAHLLTNHASFLRNRTSIADVGLKAVKILGSGLPDECSACRQISQRRFAVADAPELPLADCTCPGGCKCVLVAVDEQSDRKRRPTNQDRPPSCQRAPTAENLGQRWTESH